MKLIRPVAVAALVAAPALVLAGCTGEAAPAPGSSTDAAPAPAAGGTFTLAAAADPGALDIHLSPPVSSLLQLGILAYDPLVNLTVSGEVVSGLATDWKVDGATATFTIGDATCSDGAAFTAQTAADNLNFISDPANASPLLGTFYPAGATAAAEGSTLTVTLAAPAPFLLSSLANLPLVCDSGLADRASLAAATHGTGPFVLTEAVPNDHYTLKAREGYAWGPGGVTNAEAGMPGEVVIQVIPNETTAANLLLAGSINASTILGADADRVEAGTDFHTQSEALVGQQWYNHADGHVTADPAVRAALAQSLDFAELRNVITSGRGAAPSQFAVVAPAACQPGDLAAAIPAVDPAAAAAALDAAGWVKGADGVRAKDGAPLAVTFLYDTAIGDAASAASELVVAAWTELGVKVSPQGLPTDQVAAQLFGAGGWDVAWEPLNVSSPDQVAPYLSGPGLADGGANFAGIANADYDAALATAMTKAGADSCADFHTGESALVAASDVTVFASNVIKLYGHGATFEFAGWIIPSSIRLTA